MPLKNRKTVWLWCGISTIPGCESVQSCAFTPQKIHRNRQRNKRYRLPCRLGRPSAPMVGISQCENDVSSANWPISAGI